MPPSRRRCHAWLRRANGRRPNDRIAVRTHWLMRCSGKAPVGKRVREVDLAHEMFSTRNDIGDERNGVSHGPNAASALLQPDRAVLVNGRKTQPPLVERPSRLGK